MQRAISLTDNILNEELTRQSGLLGEILIRKGLTVSFAESCTGGLVCKSLTDNAGSSNYFKGGIVAYHDEVKIIALGVKEETLLKQGAVSAECAEEMVQGLERLFHTDIFGSVTGIAGPDGGTADKPVGTVWFSVSINRKIETGMKLFDGNREEVRFKSAIYMMKMILERITEV